MRDSSVPQRNSRKSSQPQHFVANELAVGHRYTLRMGEINEFIRFHKLPAVLTTKIRNYVEFAFSVQLLAMHHTVYAHALPEDPKVSETLVGAWIFSIALYLLPSFLGV